MGRKKKPSKRVQGQGHRYPSKSKAAKIHDHSKDFGSLASETLKNRLILRTVLKNLPVRDLLNCSLVCKSWNYEAKCVLRDFKVCFAGLKKRSSLPSCEALKNLDSILAQMNVVPFSGLVLAIRGHTNGSPPCVGMKGISRYYDYLMNQLTLKYLELSVDSYVGSYQNCPAVQLAQKILAKNCDTLEEFSIINIPRYLQLSLSEDSAKPPSFPRLTSLRVSDQMDFRYLPRNLLPDLISASPNLEELSVEACPDDLRFLPTDKLKIVKTFLFMPTSAADEELYRNFALAKPQLRDLRVRPPCLPYAEQRKFWEILKLILHSSSRSLQSLSVASIPALMLNKLAIGHLPNVTSFVLQVDAGEGARPVRSLLKRINFSVLFPCLTSVSIYEDSVYENEVLEYVDDLNPPEVRHNEFTSAISRMYISSDCFRRKYVAFLADMFPHITDLQAVMMSDAEFAPIYALWDGWPRLESIKIEEVECHNNENLDAVFCGIHPHEADFLREQDDEFLSKVQIVPTCPAITCFKQLKRLYLSFSEDPFNVEDNNKCGGELFITKVTGYVAFRRMPGLEVAFEMHDKKVLQHLDDFVTTTQRST